MGDPRSSVPSLDDHKNHFLSATSPEKHDDPSTCRRSTSITPSIRSFRSGTTEVYNEPIPELVSSKRRFKKITTTVDIKLTMWDCIKGLNPFDRRARIIPRSVEVIDEGDDTDSDEYEIQKSPFIQNVFVLSKEKDEQGRFLCKEARCSFDTGNHHGNIVSREFLVRELNIPESEFMGKRLKKYEREGISITGHILVPDGAVRLDWYHAKSTQRYRDMRFLVSPHPHCDLVIGAQSLEKYGILASPNLWNGNNIVEFNDGNTDITRQEHESNESRLKNDLDTLEEDLKDATKKQKQQKVESLNSNIALKQNEIRVAELVLKLYDAREIFKQDPTNIEKHKAVTELEEQLSAAQKLLPNQAPRGVSPPQVIITNHNGQTRTSTGFSIRTLRPRNGKK